MSSYAQQHASKELETHRKLWFDPEYWEWVVRTKAASSSAPGLKTCPF